MIKKVIILLQTRINNMIKKVTNYSKEQRSQLNYTAVFCINLKNKAIVNCNSIINKYNT